MGHQIYAGDQELYTSRLSWLIVYWCDDVTPIEYSKPYDTEAIGTTNIQHEIIAIADNTIPMSYSEAVEKGWLDVKYQYNSHPIDKDAFDEARKFLHLANVNGDDIHGSW